MSSSPRASGGYASPGSSSSQGLTDSDLHSEPSHPTRVRNRSDDEVEMEKILSRRPVIPMPEKKTTFDDRLKEVADRIYKRKDDAWKGTGYVPAYRKIGGGSYGDVFIGFKVGEDNKPFERRHYVALKECRVKCLWKWAAGPHMDQGLVNSPQAPASPSSPRASPHQRPPQIMSSSQLPSFMQRSPVAGGAVPQTSGRERTAPPVPRDFLHSTHQSSHPRRQSPSSASSSGGQSPPGSPRQRHGSSSSLRRNIEQRLQIASAPMPSAGSSRRHSPIPGFASDRPASTSAAAAGPFGPLRQSTAVGDKLCDRSVVIETRCLRSMRHENIVRLLGTFVIEETLCFYLLLEYCDAGTLMTCIEQKGSMMPEPVVRYFMRQLVAGCEYMHGERIVHRDIKPENLLLRLAPDGKNVILKIADFGLSCCYKFKANGEWTEVEAGFMTGTLPYVAPEGLMYRFTRQELAANIATKSEIEQSYHDAQKGLPYRQPNPLNRRDLHLAYFEEVLAQHRLPPLDVYAIGVTMYLLLTRHFPYYTEEWPQYLDLVFRGEAIRCQALISDETFEFFNWLTTVKPQKRPSITEVSEHWWLTTGPSHPPSPIAASQFEDFLQVTPRPLSDKLKLRSLGYEFLGEESDHFDYIPKRKRANSRPLAPTPSPHPQSSQGAGPSTGTKRQLSPSRSPSPDGTSGSSSPSSRLRKKR